MKAQIEHYDTTVGQPDGEAYLVHLVNGKQCLQVFASNGGFAISGDHVEIEIDANGLAKLEMREVRGNDETPGLARRCPDL